MKIPLSTVSLSERERGYARDALDTGWISGTGPYVARFERALAERLGRKHVIAVSSGTAALEVAVRAMGIGAGDEVIVPALTFVAPAAVVRTVGADPVFADVSPLTWTIDPDAARRLITPRTRAIIAVDVLGHPCDYDALLALGVPLIEDAAEAHGARYRKKVVGSFGAISTFSFFANKTISTGEGGCAATDDDALAETMRLIANHAMTRERPYWHEMVGHNFAMTNITAAIGLGQVERWNELVAARNDAARRYDEQLADCGCQRRPVAAWASEACWLYTVAAPERALILSALRAASIDARAIWTALPDLPLYADAVRGEYPVARQVAASAFWLPTWANMPDEAIREVAAALAAVARGFGHSIAAPLAPSAVWQP
jgi:perosamine synthetase